MEILAFVAIAIVGVVCWNAGKTTGYQEAHEADRKQEINRLKELEDTFINCRGETKPFGFPYINYGVLSDTMPRLALVPVSALLSYETEKELNWLDDDERTEKMEVEIWNGLLVSWADKNHTLAGATKDQVMKDLGREIVSDAE